MVYDPSAVNVEVAAHYRTGRVRNVILTVPRDFVKGLEAVANEGHGLLENHAVLKVTSADGNIRTGEGAASIWAECLYIECSDFQARIGTELVMERW